MDLNTMYQAGMGPLASLYAGRQAVSDQQMSAAKLRQQQLENDQSAVMNPLNAQFRQGQVSQQAAELPGIVGQSQTQAAQGKFDTDTLAQKTAAKISSYADQIGEDGMKKMGREGEIATTIAPLLDAYPPALHKEVAAKIAQKYGATPDSPVMKAIQAAPDAEVQKTLATVGSGMALASNKFLQQSALKAQEEAAANERAKGNNATSEKVATIGANSRLAVAEKKASTAMSMLTPEKRFTWLNSIPEDQLTDTERTEKNRLVKFVLSAKAAGAPGTTAQILSNADVTTPQQNAQHSADDIAPPAPQATPAPTPAGDIASAAKAAFGAYEPDKYMYRIGPNGKYQRAPKR